MTHTTNPSKSVPERSSLLCDFPVVSPLVLLVHCKQPRSKSVVRIQQLLIVANFAYRGKHVTLQSTCLCPFWLVFHVQGTGLKPSLESLVANGGCVQKSLKGSSFVVRRPLETQEENNSSQLFSRWFATSYFCSETFNWTFGQVRFLVNKLVEVRRKYLSISLRTDFLQELIQ